MTKGNHMTNISKEAICPRCQQHESYGCSCTSLEMSEYWQDQAITLSAQRDALSEYSFEATKAIVGLTAGGSEFFAGKLPDGRYKADLPRCVKYVRDTKETLHGQLIKQFVRGRLQGLDEAIEAVKAENQRRINLAPHLRLPALADELIPVLEALKGKSND